MGYVSLSKRKSEGDVSLPLGYVQKCSHGEGEWIDNISVSVSSL
jgi:hypothetical protein